MLLEGLTPSQRQYPCNYAELLKSLEPKDQEILEAAMADEKTWSAYGLHAALKKRGIRLNDKAIAKHRAKECSC